MYGQQGSPVPRPLFSAALLDAEQRDAGAGEVQRGAALHREVQRGAALQGASLHSSLHSGHMLDSNHLAPQVGSGREEQRSASAPGLFLSGRRGSQSAYIDTEQVAGVSCSTARLRDRMLQGGGSALCPRREDRRLGSSLHQSSPLLTAAGRVDREQAVSPWSRRSSLTPSLAGAVDKEQAAGLRQRLGELRMGGRSMVGLMDAEQVGGRGGGRREVRHKEVGQLNTLGEALGVARAAAVFRKTLEERQEEEEERQELEGLVPRWRQKGRRGKVDGAGVEGRRRRRRRGHSLDTYY